MISGEKSLERREVYGTLSTKKGTGAAGVSVALGVLDEMWKERP